MISQSERDRKFADRFFFDGDYDINLGRHLVREGDVWLNNPRRPLEASGTSGQKVVLNCGLNLSVLDGWWAAAYDGLKGSVFATGRAHTNVDLHDAVRKQNQFAESQLPSSDPKAPKARPRIGCVPAGVPCFRSRHSFCDKTSIAYRQFCLPALNPEPQTDQPRHIVAPAQSPQYSRDDR